jgi:hypothetical protein
MVHYWQCSWWLQGLLLWVQHARCLLPYLLWKQQLHELLHRLLHQLLNWWLKQRLQLPGSRQLSRRLLLLL